MCSNESNRKFNAVEHAANQSEMHFCHSHDFRKYNAPPATIDIAGQTQLDSASMAAVRLLITLLRDLSYALLTFLQQRTDAQLSDSFRWTKRMRVHLFNLKFSKLNPIRMPSLQEQ